MPTIDDLRRALLPELNRFSDLIDAWEEETEAAVAGAGAAIKAPVDEILTEKATAAREKLAAIEVALGGPQGQPTEPTEPPPTAEQQPA